MRDISAKSITSRSATAEATLRVSPGTISTIRRKKVPKGDPFPVARVAAIQAAKNTSHMIPYCHPLPIDFVDCRFALAGNTIVVAVDVKATYKTGVEMEALAAASAAALTLYDMLKMIDDSMEITAIRLLNKKGGKSDFQVHRSTKRSAGVLIVSDSVSARKSRDESGKLIKDVLTKEGIKVRIVKTVPDDREQIQASLIRFADREHVDLVVTTGGTGLGPRDSTPEATAGILDRGADGIAEVLRSYGQTRTPFSMLSRGKSGLRGKTLIINLPGSPKAVRDSLSALFPALHHAFTMIEGGGHRKRKR
ncbi:MAG TPA: bifunctional molybdenum cofactor biosynthesis protein MoaC/MoaB [Bacteroidota bacterium]|nr:bifunctional molybdenum cofactor biosynthesis protein MoaC/MoaB [Bacteroidota bacterium]